MEYHGTHKKPKQDSPLSTVSLKATSKERCTAPASTWPSSRQASLLPAVSRERARHGATKRLQATSLAQRARPAAARLLSRQ